MKCLGRVAPITKDIFETSEMEKKSAEAFLTSQKPNSSELDTKISTSKVDFLLEMFHRPRMFTFPKENRLLRSKFLYPAQRSLASGT